MLSRSVLHIVRSSIRKSILESGDRRYHVSFDTVTHSYKLGGVTFLVTITPRVLSSGTRGKQEMEIIKVAIGAYDPKRSPFDRGFYIGSIAFQSLRYFTRIKKKCETRHRYKRLVIITFNASK